MGETGAPGELRERLSAALAERQDLFDARRQAAFRLFAGFYEGFPGLAADLYAGTLVLHNYADPPGRGEEAVQAALAFYRERLPWLRCAVVKPRHAADPGARRGRILFGGPPDREAREAGVRYSLDVLAHRDAGLFLDTRAVRAWAREHLRGRTVLNAFAYTGSLGAAALAGGAARVAQLDANRVVLNQAKTTYTLNGFPIRKADFVAGDFWAVASRMRREGQTFDCVFLDPPFFAASGRGTVDLQRGFGRLINKARPLVAVGGWLIAINNALFVTGADCLREIEALCADGYLSIEARLPVPDDVAGYPRTRVGAPPADPAPYNHATKITVLRITHTHV
jgi:23S rRNA (cytosine1962-C5)-methyltransferase